jgi:hypothetical protein
MSAGVFTPAASSSVGAKSTLRVIAFETPPGLIFPGHRIRNGIRSDSSYINRLSKKLCSPRKNPWSEV